MYSLHQGLQTDRDIEKTSTSAEQYVVSFVFVPEIIVTRVEGLI